MSRDNPQAAIESAVYRQKRSDICGMKAVRTGV
jgi:hypothetical protein